MPYILTPPPPATLLARTTQQRRPYGDHLPLTTATTRGQLPRPTRALALQQPHLSMDVTEGLRHVDHCSAHQVLALGAPH